MWLLQIVGFYKASWSLVQELAFQFSLQIADKLGRHLFGCAALLFSNPVELNRYSYVANNPVNALDPSGLVILEYESQVKEATSVALAEQHVARYLSRRAFLRILAALTSLKLADRLENIQTPQPQPQPQTQPSPAPPAPTATPDDDDDDILYHYTYEASYNAIFSGGTYGGLTPATHQHEVFLTNVSPYDAEDFGGRTPAEELAKFLFANPDLVDRVEYY